MTSSYRRAALAALLALVAAASVQAPAQAKPGEAEVLARMMRGESAMQGRELERAIRDAEESPLGSAKNPVRVSRPTGQRAYLDRLRCSDGAAPAYSRAGNVGPGPYDNIVDLYLVTCAGGTPASSEIHMDMYHAGYAETRAVPGFKMAE